MSRAAKTLCDESKLELRTIIYVASLLEEIAKNTGRKHGSKRKRSAWNIFLSEQMKQGFTMKMAAEMDAEEKSKK